MTTNESMALRLDLHGKRLFLFNKCCWIIPGVAIAPDYFPSIADNHAIEVRVWRSELDVPEAQLKRGMLPNANRDLLYPGFPTMRHLNYTVCSHTYMFYQFMNIFDIRMLPFATFSL